MTAEEIVRARKDIETTADLLERAMKLSGRSKHLAELRSEMTHA